MGLIFSLNYQFCRWSENSVKILVIFLEPIYPAGLLIADSVLKEKKIKEKAFEEAIPEFKRFNIIENEVRNVV